MRDGLFGVSPNIVGQHNQAEQAHVGGRRLHLLMGHVRQVKL